MTDEAYSVSAINAGHGGGPAASRRDFLTLVAGAMGVLGAGAAAYTLIDSMNPAADVLAAGEPVDVDLSKVQPGQQIIVLWRGKPIFVVDRTPPLIKVLQDPKLVDRLSDPQSEANQQPPYAKNWHRSILPQYSVLVGICNISAAFRASSPRPIRPIPCRIGSAVTSVRVTAPNTILRVMCSSMSRRLIIYRSRLTTSRTSRPCALARIHRTRPGISIRSNRSEATPRRADRGSPISYLAPSQGGTSPRPSGAAARADHPKSRNTDLRRAVPLWYNGCDAVSPAGRPAREPYFSAGVQGDENLRALRSAVQRMRG